MACNLCHGIEGHTRTCASQITGHNWKPAGNAWEELSRLVLALWLNDNSLDLYIRHVLVQVREAMDDRDPVYALKLLEQYVQRSTYSDTKPD